MPAIAAKPLVLVVDDEELMRELLGEFLTRAGYDVAFSSDGNEALAKARALSPRVMVLDLMMPAMHGFDVLAKLKDDASAVKVVVVSTKDFEVDRKRALSLGAIKCLSKPVDWKALVETMHELAPVGEKLPVAEEILAAPSVADGYAPKLDSSRGCARFWGTRGSVPVSGAPYARYGGNTSCVSLEAGDDLLVFDAGTGIRPLGNALAAGKPRRVHLFVTHTHWDHIQGFPFFVPAYLPGFEISVYGAKGFGKNLEDLFRGQLDRDYFPAQLEDMRSKIEFHELAPGALRLGGVTASWEFAHHPGAAVGYKIDAAGKKVVYLSDNEFLKGYHGAPELAELDGKALAPYRALISFLSDADLLITEAQYSNDEYKAKVGWGHSSLSNAALQIKLAGVKRWHVTHHDPGCSDDELDRRLALLKQLLDGLGARCHVAAAFDGLADYL